MITQTLALFQIGFEVVNDDATVAHLLRPLSGPHIFFRRMRILCGGSVIEDIDYYNRVHELFSLHRRITAAIWISRVLILVFIDTAVFQQ